MCDKGRYEAGVCVGLAHDAHRGVGGPGQVVMAQHDGLRRPCRARCVDEGGRSGRLELGYGIVDDGRVDLIAEREEVFPAQGVVAAGVCARHHDDALEVREFRTHRLDLTALVGVLHEDDGGLGVVENVRNLFGRAGLVDACGDGVDRHRSEVHFAPLRPVVTEDTDDLSALYPGGGEGLCDPLHVSGVVGPARGDPVRRTADVVGRIVRAVLGLSKEAGGDGGRNHG